MSKTTRSYKDTVFSSLFYECEEAENNAKSLYEALTGKRVQKIEKCRFEKMATAIPPALDGGLRLPKA